MSKRLIVLLAGVLSLGLLVAGCGGGSDEEGLTKAEFIKQADAICEQANEALEGETKDYAEENGIPIDREPSDEVKEELVVEVIVPNVEGQAEEISALGAPSGDEETIDELVEGIETAAGETADDPSTVIEGDEAAFAEVNKLASDYGLKVCGDG